ncbi:MAG: DUF4190 domain-containing protein [Proteobacteria bacterium]|nr:DUF4190 domain-containing protein [Pseudomonadota bacterium]
MPPPGMMPQGNGGQPQGNGIAVAGMVLGIIARVPILGWILSLLGIIFGAVGNSKAKRVGKGKGFALAGLITGLVAAILGTVVFVLAWKAAHRSYNYSYQYNRYGMLTVPVERDVAATPDRVG